MENDIHSAPFYINYVRCFYKMHKLSMLKDILILKVTSNLFTTIKNLVTEFKYQKRAVNKIRKTAL